MKSTRKEATRSRHKRIRRKVSGTSDKPRLSIFRSNNHIVAQLIDDVAQETLAAASTLEKEVKQDLTATGNCAAAAKVGELIAQRAIAKGCNQVIFDRGGNLYHGRVKAWLRQQDRADLNSKS
jgi:large subunit ribosomal protein L18